LKLITTIITLYTLQTRLRIAPVALVVTCCVMLAVQHARQSTYDVFLYQNAWAKYSESWRVVTWRNKWNLGFI